LKFLKSPNAEKNAVTGVVQNAILALPSLKMKYIVDGDIMLDYSSGTLGGAIAGVYGDADNDKILSVDDKCGNMKLSGFVGIPEYSRRNKSAQTVIVNGRVVAGGAVAEAVNDAFENFVTTGNFAFFVLNLSMDLTEVDVNIHPRKLTVKFGNSN
jgi:DNA mismatch repair protein MutL